MGLLRLVAPTEKVLNVEEVTLRLKIDSGDDELGLERLISACTRAVENRTQRAIMTQQWEFILDGFPGGVSLGCFPAFYDCFYLKKTSNIISLPLPPLQSVDWIKYLDRDGVEQTISPADYASDKSGLLGRVFPAYGKAWPATCNQPACVRIGFTAGHLSADDVDDDLVLAILLLIGHFDVNREAVSDRQMFTLPEGVETLLAGYVIPSAP